MSEQCMVLETSEKNSRQIQAELTKKRLLTVAMRLMKEKGFDNVKISDICEEANVSTGAFYHHIRNKAGIVIEGYAECDIYFSEIISPSLVGNTSIEVVLKYIDYQMEYAEDFGADLCTQIYKAQITEGTEFFLSLERSLPNGLIELIERLQEHNVIKKDKQAIIIANELLVISRGIIYNWCQQHGSYNLRKFAHEIVSNYIQHYLV